MEIKKIEIKRTFKVGDEEKKLTTYAEYDDETNMFLELFLNMRIRLEGDLKIGDIKDWARVEWREEKGKEWYPFFFLISHTTHPIYSKMVKQSMKEWRERRQKIEK